MPNTLKIKRGLAASIPQGQLAEPLFTTDTYDLYIGKGAGGNQRIQNYIASGTSSQFLKGDGSLDSTTYQATSEKGQNNGYASLDAGGKIPAAQLPSSVIEYKGTWNASTNTPTLADGTGDAGDVYIVSVGGTQNLGSGSITFDVGDWIMYNGSIWQKSTGSNAVASVNGQTGIVSIGVNDLDDATITSPSNGQLLQYSTGTNKWVNWTPTYISAAITSLNGLTAATQTFATGTTGTDFAISSASGVHTFNLPVASATNTGKLSSTDWSTFNNKQAAGNYVTTDTTQTITAAKTISRASATFTTGGTLQSFLIDGAAGDGALTINSVTTGYAYQTFAQNQVGKFEIGIVGAETNRGSLYINRTVQSGETGASIFIKQSNGFVGINSIDPAYRFTVNVADDVWHTAFGDVSATGQQLRIGGNAANGALKYAVIGSFTSIGISSPSLLVLQRDGGNLIVGGGAPTDGGERLQVNGTARLTGALSGTSGSFSSSLSAGTTISAGGRVTITTSNTQPLVLNGSSNQYLYINSGAAEAMTQYENPTAGSWYTGIRTSAGLTDTSSYHIYSSIKGGDVFAITTSGNAVFDGSIKASISALGTAATAFLVSDAGTIKSRTASELRSDISALTTNFDTTGTLRARTAETTYRGNIGNPATDAPIRSLSNSEDNWIYLDTASTEWGIYHRNIDSNLVVAGQPTLKANSIAFIGANNLQAYICLADGEILGRSFVRYNGTSSEFLKADGSVDSNTYVTTNTTQSITGQKTISRQASTFGGTVQSFLIDGAAGDGALTLNSISTGYAYLNFAQGGTTKFEIGIVGTGGNGSLYINRNIQTGETGASIYIKKSNGFVGINGIDPQANLHVYNDSDVWHTIIGGASGELRIGGQTNTGSGAVIQSRNNAGTTRPLFLQRDGANVIINGASDSGHRLQVNGTTKLNSTVTITASTTQPLILDGSTHQYLYIASNSSSEAMTQYYNPIGGNWYTGIRVGAGIASTSAYHIYSSIYGNDVFACTTAGNAIVAGGYFESSDRRLKTNIRDYNSSEILNISAKIYEKLGQIEVGYIAQEIQEIIPSAVTVREDGYLDLSYRQVHTAKIAALEAKIVELEAKLK